MWVSQALVSLLLLMATTEAFYSEIFPPPSRYFSANEIAPIPVRETRSGIFWTGSRYNRRGSSDDKKRNKLRADKFYMGSRYGKRSSSASSELESDLCKFTSFHPLYPCSNR